MGLAEIAAETLGEIHARGTYRRMRVLDGAQAPRMRVDGRDVLLFAGSNYLDLARHPEVVEASARAAREIGCAAGGSRLISGNLALHEALEQELAKFFEAEAALAFNSGYAANLGVIPALVGRGDAVVSDALSHASIIDGCRLSRADVLVFPHGDLAALETRLAEAARDHRRVLLAIDGVYSMDGDVAPVAEMVAAAKRHGAIVLLDDAHGTGTLGARGRGSAELCGAGDIDVLLGTLGKGLGSYGAFVVGTRALRDLLVNVARSFIFSCALAPPQVAAAHAALDLVRREPWRRERLQANAARLRARLAARGVDTSPSTTHIVPVVIGASDAAMAVCEQLLERGFYAQGIRHPSVPEGTARLRLTPMATHREDEIDAVADRAQRADGERSSIGVARARGVFVTGTDTGVGKTLVACALVRALRTRGIDAGAMKPIETGVGAGGPSDAIALRRAAGEQDPLSDVCPQPFALAAAPSVAAHAEGRAVDLAAIDAAFARLRARREFLVVEGAGGLLVPIDAKLAMADLAQRMELPLLVVARAALGTINHTRLTIEAARARNLAVTGIVISHAGGALSAADEANLDALRGDLGSALLGEIPPLVAGELPDPNLFSFDRLL
jgi:glycine C-acetyltransferase